MVVRSSALGGPLNPTHRWDAGYVMAAEAFARGSDADDATLLGLAPDLLRFGAMSNGTKITFGSVVSRIRSGCSRREAEDIVATGIFGSAGAVFGSDRDRNPDAHRMVSRLCDLLGREAIRLNGEEAERLRAASDAIGGWVGPDQRS